MLYHLLYPLWKYFFLHLIFSNIDSINDVFLKYFINRVTFFSNDLKSFKLLKEGISILPKTSKNLIKFNLEINELDNKKGEVKYEQIFICINSI